MKKTSLLKTVVLTLSLTFLLGVRVLADGAFYQTSGEDDTPSVSADSFVVMDGRTGEIILSKSENLPRPIASITKIMTALVVLENADLDDMVTVTAADCGIEGSSIYLFEGEKITVKDLLYALMLESANDAAVCLANFVSGSNDAFCKLMNDRAKAIGLNNTNFNNPHGLEDPNHYSTAYDMARIWAEAMKRDDFREIVSTKSYRIDMSDGENYRFLSNHNRLLKSFSMCTGGKTGFTKTAGRCLVTSAKKGDTELIMVTLNAPDDWSDHEKTLTWALSKYSEVELARVGSVKVSVSVVGGVKNSVSLTNRSPLTVTVRDITGIDSHLEAPRFIYAPVSVKDNAQAELVYTYNGKEIARLPLYPEKNISRLKKESLLTRIFKYVFK